MPYTVEAFGKFNSPVAVNIFPHGFWRGLALLCFCVGVIGIFCKPVLNLIALYLFLGRSYLRLLNFMFHRGRSVDNNGKQEPSTNSALLTTSIAAIAARAFGALNKFAPAASWVLYLIFMPIHCFEMDYLQAWADNMLARGEPRWLTIFVGKDAMTIPLLHHEFVTGAEGLRRIEAGSDRETFEMLRMWYCFMQLKRRVGEWLLPRKLIRIDQVGLCDAVGGLHALGRRIKAFEVGRSGSSRVANFEDPSRVAPDQRLQTKDVLEDPKTRGVEFVRAWDSAAVSAISLLPFLFSLVFAAIWIGVSVGRFDVDAQVATQTAFTVAAFIVTAGALLIALFAFLDTQTLKGE